MNKASLPKLKTSHLFVLAGLIISLRLSAQTGVAINANGASADASAMLEITSTSGGLLIPRMTQTQRTNISSPATSLMVYQTNGTTPGFYYYNGTYWNALTTKTYMNFSGTTNTTYTNNNTTYSNIQSFTADQPGSYVVTIVLGNPVAAVGAGMNFQLSTGSVIDGPFFAAFPGTVTRASSVTVVLVYNKTTTTSETVNIQWAAAASGETQAGTIAVAGASTLKITCVRQPL